MAQTLVTTIVNADSPDSRRSTLLSEIWNVTGASSVANDTGVIVPRFIGQPLAVIGMFAYAISGNQITLTDTDGIGNKTCAVEVIGRL